MAKLVTLDWPDQTNDPSQLYRDLAGARWSDRGALVFHFQPVKLSSAKDRGDHQRESDHH